MVDTDNMKIIITGASGFLGKSLMEYLPHQGYIAKALSLRSPQWESEIDPTCETIIHCAGKAHSVPTTEEEEKEFFEVNYDNTVSLCHAIDKLGVRLKAFIFISTVAVYGVHAGLNLKESLPLNGTTPYAKSKIKAEMYLRDWAQRNGVVLSILRVPLIAGHNPPGNLGAMIKGIKRGRYLSVGDAAVRKSMVMTEDIAKIMSQLIEVGGTYHLTDGYHPSVGELERAIAKAVGKSNPMKIPMFVAKMMAKVGDLLGADAPINSEKLERITTTLTFDDSKAQKALGWKPERVLDKISEIV